MNNYNEQNSPLIHIRATASVRTFGSFKYEDFGVIYYYTTSLISILTTKSTQICMHLTTFFDYPTSAQHPLSAGGSEGTKWTQFLFSQS